MRCSQDAASGSHGSYGDDTILINPDESWSVPVHAVERPICIRPVILYAPDTDTVDTSDTSDTSDGANVSQKSGRVFYTYQWSDPLTKISSLFATAMKLESVLGAEATSKSKRPQKHYPSLIPSLSCRDAQHGQPFTCLVIPRVGTSVSSDLFQHPGKPTQWLDIILRA
eukprot:IDg16252t1